jgi:hypothetical protein
MPVDCKALLALWDLENIPACDVGMELAKTFLECCGAGEEFEMWAELNVTAPPASLPTMAVPSRN